MNELTIKNAIFKPCKEWNLILSKGDIITPIWKYGKIKMLLITRRKTGEAFYINACTREIFIDVSLSVISTPHGSTYLLHEQTRLTELSTWITLHKV